MWGFPSLMEATLGHLHPKVLESALMSPSVSAPLKHKNGVPPALQIVFAAGAKAEKVQEGAGASKTGS